MIDVKSLDMATLLYLGKILPDYYRRAKLVEGARVNLLDYARFQVPQYQTPKHIRVLADYLQRVERGEIKRLAISMPPRHGKSMLTSELFPSWYLGKNPDKFIICSTYSQELASDFGRKVRNFIADEQFLSVFPEIKLASDSTSATRFHTTKGGVYFAVGAGGPITGRGAHVMLIDDPIKGAEEADSEAMRRTLIEWYKSVAMTRLMPGGAIILIGTRWHEEDLIGWALENTKHEGWEVLSLPALCTDPDSDPLGRERGEALWPDSYPAERLNDLKESLGSRQWAALYMQQPTTEDGNIFPPKLWQLYQGREFECEYIIQSFDTAYSIKKEADFTAITTWGVFRNKNNVQCALLLDVFNERLEYPDLRKKAQELYEHWNPDICIIEDAASGQSLIQDLRRAGLPIATFKPDRDKVSRAHAVTPLFEAGRIYVRAKQTGDIREDALALVQQAARFPYGKHDDMVDSMVLALSRLKNGYFLTHPDDPWEDEPDPNRRARGYW